MKQHIIQVIEREGFFQARCSCRRESWRSPDRRHADEWRDEHLILIAKGSEAIASRTPSLRSQRNWFRAKADDDSNSERDRSLWRQLADELDARLGDRAEAKDEQPGLW